MKKKYLYIISFLLGSLISFVFFFYIAMFYIPKLNIEKWVANVILTKQNIAKHTPSPKIIILSGSNAFFGMRSKIIQDRCKMPVVNIAFHASFTIAFYKKILSDILQEGDIVVLPLEHNHYSNTTPWNTTALASYLCWGKEIMPIDNSYELYCFYLLNYIWNYQFMREFTLRHYNKIANKIYRVSKAPTKTIDSNQEIPIYDYRNMNNFGDIINTRNASFKLKTKLLPDDRNQLPSDFFLDNYKQLTKFIHSRKAKFVIVWPVLCTKDSIDDLEFIYEKCKNKGIIIYGNPRDFMFEPKDFSDTNYHLKSLVAEQRTQKLVDCLLKIPKLFPE